MGGRSWLVSRPSLQSENAVTTAVIQPSSQPPAWLNVPNATAFSSARDGKQLHPTHIGVFEAARWRDVHEIWILEWRGLAPLPETANTPASSHKWPKGATSPSSAVSGWRNDYVYVVLQCGLKIRCIQLNDYLPTYLHFDDHFSRWIWVSRSLTGFLPPLFLEENLSGQVAQFLANVNSRSRSRSLYAVARPSVTFVHPTHPVEIFSNFSTAFGILAIRWHPQKILRRSSQGNPSGGGIQRKRSSQILQFWTYWRLYLGNGAR